MKRREMVRKLLAMTGRLFEEFVVGGTDDFEVPRDEQHEPVASPAERIAALAAKADRQEHYDDDADASPMPGGIPIRRDMYFYIVSKGQVWEIPLDAGTQVHFRISRANVPAWAIAEGMFHPCSSRGNDKLSD